MRRVALLGFVFLAGLVLLLRAPSTTSEEQADAPPPERSFTTTSDPTEPVVSMRSRSSFSNDRSTYILYGDGRFVQETYTGSGDLLRSFETALSFEELRQVVAIAVDHGLIDTDDALIQERRQALIRQEPRRAGASVTDEGSLEVVISLASYTRDGETTEQVTKTFRPQNTMLFERIFPEISEFGGLAQLLRRLNALALQAEQQGPRKRS